MKEDCSNTSVPPTPDGFEFSYDEYLSPYKDVLQSLSSPKAALFRWMHNPSTEDDSLPQIFQSNDPRSPEDLIPPSEDAPFEAKNAYIGNFALSHFNSAEAAIKRFLEIFQSLKKRKGETTANRFVERSGQWIVKYQYSSEAAKVSAPDNKGHVNVFIRKDVDINTFRDQSFNPINMLEYDDAT